VKVPTLARVLPCVLAVATDDPRRSHHGRVALGRDRGGQPAAIEWI
jgi:hypothetical protein